MNWKYYFNPWSEIKRLNRLIEELSLKHSLTAAMLQESRQTRLCGNQGNGKCMLLSGHELPHFNPHGGTWGGWT